MNTLKHILGEILQALITWVPTWCLISLGAWLWNTSNDLLVILGAVQFLLALEYYRFREAPPLKIVLEAKRCKIRASFPEESYPQMIKDLREIADKLDKQSASDDADWWKDNR